MIHTDSNLAYSLVQAFNRGILSSEDEATRNLIAEARNMQQGIHDFDLEAIAEYMTSKSGIFNLSHDASGLQLYHIAEKLRNIEVLDLKLQTADVVQAVGACEADEVAAALEVLKKHSQGEHKQAVIAGCTELIESISPPKMKVVTIEKKSFAAGQASLF